MLYSCIIEIYLSILEKKICFKILSNINKRLLKSASISTITKQGQIFNTYNKNINDDSNVGKHIYKINHLY